MYYCSQHFPIYYTGTCLYIHVRDTKANANPYVVITFTSVTNSADLKSKTRCTKPELLAIVKLPQYPAVNEVACGMNHILPFDNSSFVL